MALAKVKKKFQCPVIAMENHEFMELLPTMH
jgi:hypothetical protein